MPKAFAVPIVILLPKLPHGWPRPVFLFEPEVIFSSRQQDAQIFVSLQGYERFFFSKLIPIEQF